MKALCRPVASNECNKVTVRFLGRFFSGPIHLIFLFANLLFCRQRGFQLIRPDNSWFPGLDKLREEFYSQHWIFEKTPKFKVSKIQSYFFRHKI